MCLCQPRSMPQSACGRQASPCTALCLPQRSLPYRRGGGGGYMRNLVQREFDANPEIPLKSLGPSVQIVAQREWWLLFPGGLWVVAVMSSGLGVFQSAPLEQPSRAQGERACQGHQQMPTNMTTGLRGNPCTARALRATFRLDSPVKNPHTDPFQTPSKLGHPSYPNAPKFKSRKLA